jgi:hypothetical protein
MVNFWNLLLPGKTEDTNLLRRQIHSNPMEKAQNLINKGFLFTRLLHNEMTATFLRDLDESIASHILDTFVGLVHKFKEFVDNSLQELPVGFEEAGVLSDNVHDIRSDNGFVVLSALDFAETEQVLDNCH